MTKYIHLRYYDKDASPLNNGGATIGYKVIKDGDKIVIHYAIAHCNLKDNFNRKIGRTIVNNRLENSDFYKLVVYNDAPFMIDGMVQRARKNAQIVTGGNQMVDRLW